MRKSLSLLLATTLTVSACGFADSRLNPVNWFGRAQSVPVEQQAAENTNPLIPKRGGLFAKDREEAKAYKGKPMDQITGLVVERVPGGAILRVTGLAARQGIYAVQLTPATDDETPVDGRLTYRLEGVKPRANTPQGSKPTREVVAARKLTDQQLRGVRSIRVEGLRNAQIVRR